MRRTIVKDFRSIFLNPTSIRAIVLLTAIVCVLLCIVDAGYARPNSRMTSLSAAVTEVHTVGRLSLNESEIEQPLQNSIMNNPIGSSEPSGEWQTVQMRVTAYCPCPKCCGEYSDSVTASGHKIRQGDAFVAADGKYSFGTEMIIPGYKNGDLVKVLDRGGVISGNRLDVFFYSHEEALKWGVRHLSVKVRRK